MGSIGKLVGLTAFHTNTILRENNRSKLNVFVWAIRYPGDIRLIYI